jgi:hypothetical protein
MPKSQTEMMLPPRLELVAEEAPARETRELRIVLRALQDAVTEIGRKTVCYDLELTEERLSKQLNGVDGKTPSFRLLAYCLKHEKSGRLARALVADYAGYAPPVRAAVMTPEEKLARLEAAMKANPALARVLTAAAFGDAQ